jgi:hypothetical protein
MRRLLFGRDFQAETLLVNWNPKAGRVFVEEVMVLLNSRETPLHPALLDSLNVCGERDRGAVSNSMFCLNVALS